MDGGLGLFDPEHYDGLTRKMCLELNAVVISIDYRLTPEHVFPIPFEDSFKATKWFLLHAVDYNVDAERVAIGGDSAGGYLSTTVAQAIHDDATTFDLKLQVLLYPWLQILDLKTPSYQKYRYEIGSEGIIPLEIVALFAAMHVYGLQTNETILEAFMTNNHISEEFKQGTLYKEKLSHSLLPSKHRDYPYYQPPTKSFPQSDDGRRIWEESSKVFLDPKLSPLLMEDLTGMPVTYIVTVEYDSIRDDGIIYGKLLEQAGVDVTWRHYDNAFHGIIWVAPGIIFEDGSKIMEEVYTFVRSKL
ncbi:arylacetamide deacetylase-like isoform X2 [Apostichopus japonicus]|uniref:arylacetamide deacetylase-like isoform X2 n=1 Tax=Stichopus japonicus TaxID=307972 RepID=UPI003AB5B34E